VNVHDWLESRTILLVRHGSHAYGTAIESSDEDFKGVAVPPREYRDGFLNHFEQAETKKPDKVVYDLRKFMRLAADCNPSVNECLYVEDSDRLVCTPAGESLLEVRDQFLSRKAKHTYSGYAVSQLKRIKTHHRWLQNPPKVEPTRTAFNLPERTLIPKDQLEFAEWQVARTIGEWQLDYAPLDEAGQIYVREKVAEFMATLLLSERGIAMKVLGFSEDFMEVLDRERKYRAARTEWEQFQNWQETRNPARASLEAKHGYDTKHAMHVVRLLRMCREILTLGKVIVRRPDAEELLSIRRGAWTLDQLLEFAAREDQEMNELLKTSPLPREPDRVALDNTCLQIHELVERTSP
jgi:predicted nucleotidyltransferase